MKLTRLHVHHYRELAPDTALTFGPTLNVVVGATGSGRTTLLDLVSRVLCSDFSGLLREPFSLDYALRFDGLTVEVAVRNEPPAALPAPKGEEGPGASLALPPAGLAHGLMPSIVATVRWDAAEDVRLVMRASATGFACEVDGAAGFTRRMHWSVLDRSVWTLLFMAAQYLERGVKDRLKDLLRRTFLLAPPRFDESLGMFEHLGAIRYAMERRGEDLFPLGLMALPTWMPGWLREQVEHEPLPPTLMFRHETLPESFLARFVTLAGFASGTLTLDVTETTPLSQGGRLGFSGFRFAFVRGDGTPVAQEQLGYGQRRLLSFLYYLDVHDAFVIADELPDGLHPDLVAACVKDVGERQAFLTSQNPLLFEHLSFRDAEDLRTSVIHCEGGTGRGAWRWTQPSPEVAARLFSAYREGARPLGAVLRAQGFG
ncbi:ATP-binding protein [Corallococcus sp. ZKHCc1 1396]|uniref:ATP-binding protein n=1 Tax=Corallococcus soli TaxID=2710757 RepID=A0ABR9PZ66_9BACT|nr:MULTISPECIES: ATP-binding protein [Corallococcus]MBE4753144.1 ATP-binding protein [Corallococcus soli]MCY1031644.1 ATP-binding protein [Corallococcus sp. BB11-1]